MEATIQVLVRDGTAKLTTTRIAERAGVSVGTLYQYFPNKRSLLQALLTQHLEEVARAVEDACASVEGATLREMAEGIVSAFAKAKFRRKDASVGLYAVSDEVGGKEISRGMHQRIIRAMTALFGTAREGALAEPEAVSSTLLSARAGVSRATLERGATRGAMERMERELTVLARAYLEASAGLEAFPLPGEIAGSGRQGCLEGRGTGREV